MPRAATQSLHRRASSLAAASEQLRLLNQPTVNSSFSKTLASHGLPAMAADGIETLQLNLGKMCNMTCRHCHVDAGPDRQEIMSRATIDDCLAALRRSDIRTLDLTGGAPEMNPDFRYMVTAARAMGLHVIDRCNLTILLANGFDDLAQFLADHQVEIVASLPCYLESNTDQQRGEGAYQESITALRRLNALGYGDPNSGLCLTLVYNPIGPSLPPDQEALERDYRDYLGSEFGIVFDRLFTITNMPISRFLEELVESGEYERYMQSLVDAFNPAAAQGVMCRKMISVGWDGTLYDCDFNQMLELPVRDGQPNDIRQFDASSLGSRMIVTGPHCFGCAAAAGSGCLGAIENNGST